MGIPETYSTFLVFPEGPIFRSFSRFWGCFFAGAEVGGRSTPPPGPALGGALSSQSCPELSSGSSMVPFSFVGLFVTLFWQSFTILIFGFEAPQVVELKTLTPKM